MARVLECRFFASVCSKQLRDNTLTAEQRLRSFDLF